MQAIDSALTKIINGTTQFTIPVFQRDYTWTEVNCEQLWKDVIRIGNADSDRVHFLGSLVYTPSGDSSAGFTQYQVIDGQQRLTTWTLMMIALRDHLVATNFRGPDDGPTAKRIDAYFLKNEQEENDRRYKLQLRRKDQATLRALIDGQRVPEDGSEKIKDNYDFFQSMIVSESPVLVYKGLGRLKVVDVKLDTKDNPQLVFESLNSTGVDLSQSDLIRNFILMRLPEREQNRLYESVWSNIEKLFRGSDNKFDAFARDYVALHTHAAKQEKSSHIYRAFRNVFDDLVRDAGGLDALLGRMYRYARYYAAFTFAVGVPPLLKEAMHRLSSLVDVPAILVMRLFNCHEDAKTLPVAEFQEALALLESYVLRRSVCDGQTRGYGQVFADIAYEIDDAQPLRSLKASLASQHESYAFPSDEEFKNHLAERDLYRMRNCMHILVQLENHGSRELTDTSNLEIEHVLPQNPRLNAEWRKMLGPEWKEVQQLWLHRLGNLTLTGYNSKYSDRSFEEKKTISDGFSESAVRLNRYICSQAEWTDSQMAHRSKELTKRATLVWPLLVADPSAISEMAKARLLRRSARNDAAKLELSEPAKVLFDQLRIEINKAYPDAAEMMDAKSISYHGPMFFLEVLPRKNKLSLVLPLEFHEIADPADIASDATEWKFLIHAKYSGGVLLRVRTQVDIEAALPIIKQAFLRTHAVA
jgi:predicted transport protein